jgi:hypothetical protein
MRILMTIVADELRARTDAFVSDLSELIRKAAFEAVHEALGAGVKGASAPRASRGRGRAAKKMTEPKTATQTRAAKRAPGQKRDPQELKKLVERLAAHIKANPGQRIEEINKALGVPTKDLALPVKKLLAGKRISTKGQKRSTTYFPTNGLVKLERKAKGATGKTKKTTQAPVEAKAE